MNNRLKKIFNTDPQKTIATRGFFANYPVSEFYIHKNSAIIFGKSDHMWAHLISSSELELKNLLKQHQSKTRYFYSVEEWMIPLILEYGKPDWIMKTRRYILSDSINVPKAQQQSIPLSIEQTHHIFTHSDYQKYTSIDYIEDRLQKGVSTGIQLDGQLVAWGFTHDDGALGFLHVLPDYRKQGLGKQVLLSLIHQRKAQRQPVFCNIVPDNLPSINLVEKIGFEFDRFVNWVKLK